MTKRASRWIAVASIVGAAAVAWSASGGPQITLDTHTVTLAQDVDAGPASSMIHVSNAGSADLSIGSIVRSGGTDWSFTATAPCTTTPCTVPMGTSFDIAASFDPVAIGPHDASLTIMSNDPDQATETVMLDGTGQGATLALATALGNPPTIDLGTVPIGTPTQATFELKNDGNIDLTPVMLGITQTGSELSLDNSQLTIPGGTRRAVVVKCIPTAPTELDGTIDITAVNAVTGSPISIGVTCAGTTGNLFATPASVQLGEIRIGSGQLRRTFMLKTIGPNLTITAGPTLTTPVTGMSVSAASPTMISMTAPSSFELVVDPVVDTNLATSISVTATGNTIAIPVTGQVVTPSVAVPEIIMAGSFCVGQSTIATQGLVTADGTATINLATKPVMNGMSASPFQLTYSSPMSYPYQLSPGTSAQVLISPLRQMTAGMRSDELVWTTDAPGMLAPRTQVTAEFIADGGAIAPQLVDFGGVALKRPANDHVITIQNCGMDTMDLGTVSIDHGDEFKDTSPDPLPATLSPNQTATLSVGFKPTKVGVRTAVLVVDSSKGPLRVNLQGQGIGDPDTKGDTTSFYACNCRTSHPSAAWPALVVLLVLRRRRQR